MALRKMKLFPLGEYKSEAEARAYAGKIFDERNLPAIVRPVRRPGLKTKYKVYIDKGQMKGKLGL